MSESMWVRSHVRQLLQEEWDVCRVEVDGDGDVPFRYGSAACWVSVRELGPVMVRVFAHAAYGVKPSAKLLRMLNETQLSALSTTIAVVDDIVVVSQTICAEGLTRPVLSQAITAVTGVADDIGPLVAAMFDGQTPHPADVDVDEEAV